MHVNLSLYIQLFFVVLVNHEAPHSLHLREGTHLPSLLSKSSFIFHALFHNFQGFLMLRIDCIYTNYKRKLILFTYKNINR